jgi:hypothetical protein
MVPNTREDFPDPETPVKTVSRRLGRSSETSLRLFSLAPRTSITSWVSATGVCCMETLQRSQAETADRSVEGCIRFNCFIEVQIEGFHRKAIVVLRFRE